MAAFIFPAAMPPWDECASSMMIPKFLPDMSPIVPQMNGNFCIVVMTMRLPFSMAVLRSFELSACATIPAEWPNALMLSVICLSRMRRSVTTSTVSKSGTPSPLALFAPSDFGHTPISLYANHVSELLLPDPAECWMRYRLPTPFSDTSPRSASTTSS